MANNELAFIAKTVKVILWFVGIGIVISLLLLCVQFYQNRSRPEKNLAEVKKQAILRALKKEDPASLDSFEKSNEYKSFLQTQKSDSVTYYFVKFDSAYYAAKKVLHP